jgi:hypothetical protein
LNEVKSIKRRAATLVRRSMSTRVNGSPALDDDPNLIEPITLKPRAHQNLVAFVYEEVVEMKYQES